MTSPAPTHESAPRKTSTNPRGATPVQRGGDAGLARVIRDLASPLARERNRGAETLRRWAKRGQSERVTLVRRVALLAAPVLAAAEDEDARARIAHAAARAVSDCAELGISTSAAVARVFAGALLDAAALTSPPPKNASQLVGAARREREHALELQSRAAQVEASRPKPTKKAYEGDIGPVEIGMVRRRREILAAVADGSYSRIYKEIPLPELLAEAEAMGFDVKAATAQYRAELQAQLDAGRKL